MGHRFFPNDALDNMCRLQAGSAPALQVPWERLPDAVGKISPGRENGVAMKEENQPWVHMDVVIVRRKHDGSAVARCRTLMRDGTWHSTIVQEWPHGRPDEPQLELLVAGVCDELTTLLLGSVGVQIDLLGT